MIGVVSDVHQSDHARAPESAALASDCTSATRTLPSRSSVQARCSAESAAARYVDAERTAEIRTCASGSVSSAMARASAACSPAAGCSDCASSLAPRSRMRADDSRVAAIANGAPAGRRDRASAYSADQRSSALRARAYARATAESGNGIHLLATRSRAARVCGCATRSSSDAKGAQRAPSSPSAHAAAAPAAGRTIASSNARQLAVSVARPSAKAASRWIVLSALVSSNARTAA